MKRNTTRHEKEQTCVTRCDSVSVGLCCPLLEADGVTVETVTQGERVTPSCPAQLTFDLQGHTLLSVVLVTVWLSICSSASPSWRRTLCQRSGSGTGRWLAVLRMRARKRATPKPHPSSNQREPPSPGTSTGSWWRSPTKCSSSMKLLLLLSQKLVTQTLPACHSKGHQCLLPLNYKHNMFSPLFVPKLASFTRPP